MESHQWGRQVQRLFLAGRLDERLLVKLLLLLPKCHYPKNGVADK